MVLQVRQHQFNPASWLVTLVVGLLLVALAAPGLMSLSTARSASALVGGLPAQEDARVFPELQAAVQKLEAAMALEPGRRQYAVEQTTLLLHLYYQLKSTRRRSEAGSFLKRASLAITRSLKRAPGDANLWYLLAEIRTLQGQMDGKTRRILGMSYLTGPREGWVSIRRLQFSLRYWLLLDSEVRRLVKREIGTLWSDPNYRRVLMRRFASQTIRVQRLIFSHINTYGEEEGRQFQKLARRAGWSPVLFR